jgi:trehalose 6-phosphate phosphatase
VARLPVAGLTYLGLYGLEEAMADAILAEVGTEAEEAAAVVPESGVEHKGLSIAVHYRLAPDPAAARIALARTLGEVAARHGLRVVEGKAVLELLPVAHPLKGGAVERIAGERGLDAVLFAGDDVADVEAFEALDRMADAGVATLKVAVLGPEAPEALAAAADLGVEGPTGLVDLLRRLVDAPGSSTPRA